MVAAATVLQLRERCPRCNARLRTKSLLRLPARCNICGIAFDRPPVG
jgi:predicted Zn-ribbon and HTH transcriptional regulator